MSDLRKPVARSLPTNPVDLRHQQLATNYITSEHDANVQTRPNSSLGVVLNLREAAAILHCHPKTLRLMAQANKIPARRVGKLWRFSEDRLKEWLKAS